MSSGCSSSARGCRSERSSETSITGDLSSGFEGVDDGGVSFSCVSSSDDGDSCGDSGDIREDDCLIFCCSSVSFAALAESDVFFEDGFSRSFSCSSAAVLPL